MKSHEATSIWQFSHFQYLIIPLAFSIISNFRKPFYTNLWFNIYFFLAFLITFVVLFSESETKQWIFKTVEQPLMFKIWQSILLLLQLVLSIGIEIVIFKKMYDSGTSNHKSERELLLAKNH
jgi:hypothetical protein